MGHAPPPKCLTICFILQQISGLLSDSSGCDNAKDVQVQGASTATLWPVAVPDPAGGSFPDGSYKFAFRAHYVAPETLQALDRPMWECDYLY